MAAERATLRSQFVGLASARLVSSAVQAAVGIGLARAVAPADYGLIAAVAGAALLWFIVCDVGVSSHIGRLRAVGTRADVEAALLLNASSAVGGAIVAAAAVWIVAGPGSIDLAAALSLVVVAQALDKNIDGATAVPIADGEVVFPAVSSLVRRLVTAGVFFALLLAGVDPLLAYGTAVVAGPLVGQVQLRLKLASMGLRGRGGADHRRILRTSVPFAFNDIAIQSRNLDVSVVALVTGPGTAGLYAAASKLTAPFQLITSTLAAVILPRAAVAERDRLRRGATTLMVGAVLLLVPTGAVAWFAEPVIVFVVGAEYRAAATALGWMLLALPFVGAAAPLASMLQGLGRERLVALNSAAFAVLILLAVAVGAFWGSATGAAVGFAALSLAKCVSLAVPLIVRSTPAESEVHPAVTSATGQ